jgi:hypothetical protein
VLVTGKATLHAALVVLVRPTVHASRLLLLVSDKEYLIRVTDKSFPVKSSDKGPEKSFLIWVSDEGSGKGVLIRESDIGFCYGWLVEVHFGYSVAQLEHRQCSTVKHTAN